MVNVAGSAGHLTPETAGGEADWAVSARPVGYEAAIGAMEARVEAISKAAGRQLVWMLEHPPLYTGGTSARGADLLMPKRFPVFRTGRGGQYTYHGPGQRVGYVMLDLKAREGRRRGDVRAFVRDLEAWLIATLARFGVSGERRDDRVGVWVKRADGSGEDKIAAIGVRVRRWISFHGVSLNLDPDLEHFSGIVPCGVSEHGVTSLRALGVGATMAELDDAMREEFQRIFRIELQIRKNAPA